MTVITSDPFNTLGQKQVTNTVEITGTYRMPDGVHTRLKAGNELPEGYTLVAADPGVTMLEARAEAAAPENKAELPPVAKEQAGKKRPGSNAAKVEGKKG